MAINLGAMIQAARSQRNPAGEAITNYQNMDIISNILKDAGLRGQPNVTEPQPTDEIAQQPSAVDGGVAAQQDPVKTAGLWEMIKRGLV